MDLGRSRVMDDTRERLGIISGDPRSGGKTWELWLEGPAWLPAPACTAVMDGHRGVGSGLVPQRGGRAGAGEEEIRNGRQPPGLAFPGSRRLFFQT